MGGQVRRRPDNLVSKSFLLPKILLFKEVSWKGLSTKLFLPKWKMSSFREKSPKTYHSKILSQSKKSGIVSNLSKKLPRRSVNQHPSPRGGRADGVWLREPNLTKKLFARFWDETNFFHSKTRFPKAENRKKNRAQIKTLSFSFREPFSKSFPLNLLFSVQKCNYSFLAEKFMPSCSRIVYNLFPKVERMRL
jgi:hypothetical protein